MRFPIRFDRWYRVLSLALGLSPAASFVEIEGDEVRAQMGWAFRARFPRSAVVSAAPYPGRPLSRGVHGIAGRWLVNGSGRGLVEVNLAPGQRARVVGLGVGLRQLLVSVEDPEGLRAALRG